MSTCQIEVVEFGQAMDRPWEQNRLEGVIKPNYACSCNCGCSTCAESATLDSSVWASESGKEPH